MSSSRKKRDFSFSPLPSPQVGSPTSREKAAQADHRVRVETAIKAQGGITGLGLAQFSDNDRFAAIVKFLANPEVFRKVVANLRERHPDL
jgi:hypothetical protein